MAENYKGRVAYFLKKVNYLAKNNKIQMTEEPVVPVDYYKIDE